MRHTLNSINNNYKNALIRWVDTDVFVLLISYTGQVELNDIEIHVFLINSTGFTTSNIIQELGSDIFLALPFFYSFTNMILYAVFMIRVSVKHVMVGLKVKGKMISLMFLSSLGKTLPMEHLIRLTCSRILCCS